MSFSNQKTNFLPQVSIDNSSVITPSSLRFAYDDGEVHETVGRTLADQRGVALSKAKFHQKKHAEEMKQYALNDKKRTQERNKHKDILYNVEIEDEIVEISSNRRNHHKKSRASLRAASAALNKFVKRHDLYLYNNKKFRQELKKIGNGEWTEQVDADSIPHKVQSVSEVKDTRDHNSVNDDRIDFNPIPVENKCDGTCPTPRPKWCRCWLFELHESPFDNTHLFPHGVPAKNHDCGGKRGCSVCVTHGITYYPECYPRHKGNNLDCKDCAAFIARHPNLSRHAPPGLTCFTSILEGDLEEKVDSIKENGAFMQRISNIVDLWKERFKALFTKGEGVDKVMKVIDIIHDVSCFIYVLASTNNRLIIYSVASLFMRRFNLPTGMNIIVSSLVSLIHKAFSKAYVVTWTEQALSDDLFYMASNVGKIISADIVTAFRDLALIAATNWWFSKPMAQKVYNWCGEPIKGGFFYMIELTLNSFAKIVRTFEMWNSGMTLSEAMFAKDPVGKAVADIQWCVTNENNTYTGIPVPGAVSRSEYADKLKAAVEILEYTKKNQAAKVFKDSASHRALLEGYQLSIRLKKLTTGQFRDTPMVFVVTGPPSIGKSKMINLIASAHCAVRGVKFHAGMQFTRCAASDYWDTYDPQSQKVVFYSEMGAYKSSLVANKGDDLLKEFLSLADSLPFPVNMSRVEDKGLYFADPWVVIVDTNNKSMNIDAMFNAPAAIRRRMIYIEPVVLPQFTGSDGVTLDPAKSLASENRFMDKWVWTVTQELPVGSSGRFSQRHAHLECASTDKFVQWLTEFSYDWINKQQDLSKLTNDGSAFFGYGVYQKQAQELIDQEVSIDDVKCADKRTEDLIKACMRTMKEVKDIEEKSVRMVTRTSKLVDKITNWARGVKNDAKLLTNRLHNFEAEVNAIILDAIGKCKKLPRVLRRACHEVEAQVLGGALDLESALVVFSRKLQAIPKWADKISATVQMDFIIAIDKMKKWLMGFKLLSADGKQVDPLKHLRGICFEQLCEQGDFDAAAILDEAEPLDEIDAELDSFLTRVQKPEEEVKEDVQEQSLFVLLSVSALVLCWVEFGENCVELQRWWNCAKPWLSAKYARMLINIRLGVVQPFIKYFKLEKWASVSKARITMFFVCMVLYILGYSNLLLFFAVCVLPFLKYSYVLATQMREDVEERLAVAERNFYVHAGKELVGSFTSVKYASMILQGAMIAGTLGLTVNEFQNQKKKQDASAPQIVPLQQQAKSEFVIPSNANSSLEDMEKKMEIRYGAKPMQNKVQASWNVRTILQTAVFKGEPSELYDVIKKNLRLVTVEFPDKSVRKTHVLGVKGQYALINRHALANAPTIVVKISTTYDLSNDTNSVVTIVRQDECVKVGPDIMLIKLNANFANIIHHIAYEKDLGEPSYMGVIGGDPVHAEFVVENCNVDTSAGTVYFTKSFRYQWVDAVKGACGTPLIIKHGNGAWIAGFHSFGKEGTKDGMAMILNREVIEAFTQDIAGAKHLNITSQALKLPELGEVSKRSPFVHENLQSLVYLGKEPGPVCVNQKSRVVPSKLNVNGDIDLLFFEKFDYVPTTRFGPPMMTFSRTTDEKGQTQYVSPINIALTKMSVEKKPLDSKILDVCIAENLRFCVSKLEEGGVQMGTFGPYSIDDAINGVLDDPSFRRVDPSKSAGYGYHGKKHLYIPLTEKKGRDVYREPVESLKEEILATLQAYERGENVGIIFKGQLKDEPRSIEKIKSGKTRLFAMTPFASLVISRMLLGPIMSLMLEHNEAFSVAIGIDMHREADKVWDKLASFSDNYMEGDYSNYDQSMPFDLRKASFTFIKQLAGRLGYSDYALRLLDGLFTDLLYPIMEIHHELFIAVGYGPSGMYATAEINSVNGKMMLLYAWYSNPKLEKLCFHLYVLALLYGDDVATAVKDAVKEDFNNITYAKVCKDTYGVTYTTASKTLDIPKFVLLKILSFLKRVMRWSKLLNRRVAPLDMSSLMKTLSWTIPSETVTDYTQTISCCNSVMIELIFHTDDLEKLESFRQQLFEVFCKSFPACDKTIINKDLFTVRRCLDILTIDKMEEQSLCELSLENRPVSSGRQGAIDLRFIGDGMPELSHSNDEPTHTDVGFGRLTVGVQRPSVSLLRRQLELYVIERDELKEVESPCPGASVNDILRSPIYQRDFVFRSACDDYIAYVTRRDELDSTIAYLSRALARRSNTLNYEAQSEDLVFTPAVTTTENVVDHMGETKEVSNFGSARGDLLLSAEQLDLDSFFKRPIDISSGALPQNTDVNIQFDPFALYLANPSVRAKLRNYAYLKGDIHLRIHISGTPFNQGRMLVTALPWKEHNPFCLKYESTLAGTRQAFIAYLASTKDVKYMPVESNEPMEVVLPYLSPKPVGSLFNTQSTVITASTNFTDFTGMYEFYFYTLNQVESVSQDPTDVYYQIFAWMDNVTLSVPTSTKLAVDTQSEFVAGPIEKATTSLLATSQALESVPIIGPYAKASSSALSVAKDVSHVLGLSRPNMMSDPERVKSEPFQNAAICTGGEVGHRLTLDPKQEISVSTEEGDVKHDEMMIKSFCETWGFLRTFDWTSTDEPLSTLYTGYANPGYLDPFTYLSSSLYQPTPLAFASMFFSHWRGDLEFKFDIVASKFHRGRIAIGYDPNVYQRDLIKSAVQLNQERIVVIDLQTTRTFSIVVKWAHGRLWAQIANATFTPTDPANMFGTNGFLYVYPLTKLQSPQDKSVHINVFIRSTDMHFNFFSSEIFKLYTPQWTTEESKKLDFEQQCDSEWTEVITPNTATPDHVSLKYFGEEPLSFRQLLKRYATQWESHISSTDTYVLMAGPIRNQVTGTPDDAPTNYEKYHSYSWLKYCFLGFKGGMKLRHYINVSIYHQGILVRVRNQGPYEFTSSYVNAGASAYSTLDSGGTAFILDTNAGVEVEHPYYCNNSFLWSQQPEECASNDPIMDPYYLRNYQVAVLGNAGNGGNVNYQHVVESAIGDDFTFVRYVAVPPFFVSF